MKSIWKKRQKWTATSEDLQSRVSGAAATSACVNSCANPPLFDSIGSWRRPLKYSFRRLENGQSCKVIKRLYQCFNLSVRISESVLSARWLLARENVKPCLKLFKIRFRFDKKDCIRKQVWQVSICSEIWKLDWPNWMDHGWPEELSFVQKKGVERGFCLEYVLACSLSEWI